MFNYLGFTHDLLDDSNDFRSPLQLCSTHSLSSRVWLVPRHYCCCPWWSSHGTSSSKNAGIFGCNWAVLSPIASHRLSSSCRASTFLHDPFNYEPTTATKTAPSQMVFSGLPQCQASAVLLQNQHHVHDKYTLPSSAATMRYNNNYLWNTVSRCSQKTLLRRFDLNDAVLFLNTTNSLAPVKQCQISQ